MSEHQIFPVPADWAKNAWADKARYEAMYRHSTEDPEGFWGEQGKRLDWIRPYTQVKDVSFASDDLHIRWFHDGTLNACSNCLDRHLRTRGDQAAIIWEGDDPTVSRTLTYRELHTEVCKFSNVLKSLRVKRGDRVTIYMPMIPEAAVAMLACARIGAIHSVVFGGFSPEALANRLKDCASTILITADEGVRGGNAISMKGNADAAMAKCPEVDTCVVVRRTGGKIEWREGRDHWYEDLMSRSSADCPPEEMNAEDPLYILYTSGSTGKPKGVVHTTGGYLTYAALTHQYVLDYHDGDVYWCTADVGWVTGHSYIVYGPLANGATTVMFEGVPNYPDSSRFWQVCDKHQVQIIYTAPTAIRALMRDGDAPVRKTSRKSLRLLGTVGEPINPASWLWYYEVVGEKRCPVIDTWWQTETGGILIAPLPGAMTLKPGAATRPFFGIQPALVGEKGEVIEGAGTGSLCMLDSWPGQMRYVYGDPNRMREQYFSQFEGKYYTGDGCYRDADGDYWITGRIDDVVNVSGHRLGTAEVESALVTHPDVAEAAVVGYPHALKGQGIYAYVTLKVGVEPAEVLRDALVALVRKEIGPIASPDFIQWAPVLPKTRSGKIMRRILRKIADGDYDNLGDVSTLADPRVVKELIDHRIAH
ncbi:acetate--CoA ligase [Paraburkholderia gardini]|uniref:Acetyl-coenzyme A synthetase n=1 Tax=Paraburkholderia gardini TaxID=2823469 RepID=A0ABM8TYR2_9BURK|nr:acetate--CoA ligase [Paraburkholderia gardini]CAG4889079.1 Acetyl-coenzyme A synthetase [Paraburkholderia gardini]CAG4896725.1 Acetyl-coenzyme A synthetase [Paraburkholderia gardini]